MPCERGGAALVGKALERKGEQAGVLRSVDRIAIQPATQNLLQRPPHRRIGEQRAHGGARIGMGGAGRHDGLRLDVRFLGELRRPESWLSAQARSTPRG
jgi:hypothetical protein